jgi:hypothetical protein
MSKKLTGVSTIRLAVLTPWFPGSMTPVREGVYQREVHFGIVRYSLWDGHQWCSYSGKPADAAAMSDRSMVRAVEARWRGLAEQPK